MAPTPRRSRSLRQGAFPVFLVVLLASAPVAAGLGGKISTDVGIPLLRSAGSGDAADGDATEEARAEDAPPSEDTGGAEDTDSDPADDASSAAALPARGGRLALGPAAAAAESADLSIEKVDSADPVEIGATFTYTLYVNNSGPNRATDVVATDTLPAGVTYVSASAGCSRAGSVVTCTRNNLNSGAAISWTITVTAATSGEWTNVASVDASQDDPDGSDNEARETTRIRPASPTGLTCVANSSGVQLDWNDVAQATGYNVYRRTGTSGPFVFLATSASSDHLDTTAAVGQSYQYRVTTLSPGGESEPTAHCTVVSVPLFPSLVAGAVALGGSVGAYAFSRRRRT